VTQQMTTLIFGEV